MDSYQDISERIRDVEQQLQSRMEDENIFSLDLTSLQTQVRDLLSIIINVNQKKESTMSYQLETLVKLRRAEQLRMHLRTQEETTETKKTLIFLDTKIQMLEEKLKKIRAEQRKKNIESEMKLVHKEMLAQKK